MRLRECIIQSVIGWIEIQAFALAVLVSVTSAYAQGTDETKLSVEETLGAVRFLTETDGFVHILAHANPGALCELRALRDDPHLERDHQHNVFLMLGYIGTKDDVPELEKIIHERHVGKNDSDNSAALAIFEALGILSRRNIKEADDLLSRMATQAYWRKHPLKWMAPNAPVKYTNEDVSVVRVISAWSLFREAKDLQKVIVSASKSSSTPEGAKHLSEMLNPTVMDRRRISFHKAEQSPILANERKDLRELRREMVTGKTDPPARKPPPTP